MIRLRTLRLSDFNMVPSWRGVDGSSPSVRPFVEISFFETPNTNVASGVLRGTGMRSRCARFDSFCHRTSGSCQLLKRDNGDLVDSATSAVSVVIAARIKTAEGGALGDRVPYIRT